MLKTFERNFIFLLILTSSLGFIYPDLFYWTKNYIHFLLGVVMLGIGYSIDKQDKIYLINSNKIICIIVLARYILMPVIGFLIGFLLKIPEDHLIGIVILSSCPGGTAASLMSVFSKANVCLTVVLTFGTTLIAPILMPLFIYLFLHKYISIPFLTIFPNMFYIVFFPITLGLFLKRFKNQSSILTNTLPVVSGFAIIIIIAGVVSQTKNIFLNINFTLILSILLLNVIGYISGFLLATLLKFKIREKKSLMFEFGMFDTALGVMIATNAFNPIFAIPCIYLTLIQNITGFFIVRIDRSLNHNYFQKKLAFK